MAGFTIAPGSQPPAPQGVGGAPQSSVDLLTNPAPALSPDLQGQATGSTAPVPITFPKFTQNMAVDPAFAPKATGFFGSGPMYDQTAAQDPTASPFSKMVANNSLQTSADQLYQPLTETGNGFSRALGFFSKVDPSAPTQDQLQQAGHTFQDPRAKAIVMSDKSLYDAAIKDPVGFAGHLQKQLDLADQAPPTHTEQGKQIDPQHAAVVAQKATAADVPTSAAYAMHHPAAHSEDEFVNAIKGLSWNQMQRLWGMQHWIPPQQQIAAGFMTHLSGVANQADAEYNALLNGGGAKPEDLAVAKSKRDAAYNDAMNGAARMTYGPNYSMPNMQEYQVPQ